jgi:hypothetical protein
VGASSVGHGDARRYAAREERRAVDELHRSGSVSPSSACGYTRLMDFGRPEEPPRRSMDSYLSYPGDPLGEAVRHSAVDPDRVPNPFHTSPGSA